MKTSRPFILRLSLVLLIGIAGVIVAVPRYGKWKSDARGHATLKHGYQIHQALYAYATGNDQFFPTSPDYVYANDAFRELFRADLMQTEQPFFLAGSKWCVGDAPDEVIGNAATNYVEALAPGENHWYYHMGLTTDRDDTSTPLLHSDDLPGLEVKSGGSIKLTEPASRAGKDLPPTPPPGR